MLKAWTIRRATALGIPAGLAALVLWPIHSSFEPRAFWPFVAALAVASFCGLSILLITGVDMVLHRRGQSLRPVRAFDIVLGSALAVPSLIHLNWLLTP
jgi:hypothetical protein